MDAERIAQNLACVEAHFHSEAVDEVEAALDLYTDDIVWEAPALNGLDRRYAGKEAVTKNYRELFAAMRNVRFQFLQRFATEENRVVDDSIVTFEIARVGYWPWPLDAKIEMRLVHIFEMRAGKIARESRVRHGPPGARVRRVTARALRLTIPFRNRSGARLSVAIAACRFRRHAGRTESSGRRARGEMPIARALARKSRSWAIGRAVSCCH